MKAHRRDHVEVVHVALPSATDKQTNRQRPPATDKVQPPAKDRQLLENKITIYQLIDYRQVKSQSHSSQVTVTHTQTSDNLQLNTQQQHSRITERVSKHDR